MEKQLVACCHVLGNQFAVFETNLMAHESQTWPTLVARILFSISVTETVNVMHNFTQVL